MEVRKQFQIEISNRFEALKNLNDSEDINIRENIKVSAKETLGLYGQKQHKPWFNEECLQVLRETKQAKMQWLQNQNQTNLDNLNNARHEASRHFTNKKREDLKTKINELETNSKNIRELYRGISGFKKGYQPRTNIVKDAWGNLVADCHSIVTRWRNYFSHLLNVHWDSDVRQTEIHTAEPLVPEPSAFQVEMAIEKVKRYKSPGIEQIPAELIKAGGSKIYSEIHKLINFIWNKEELPEH
jgi:hypothetical protein